MVSQRSPALKSNYFFVSAHSHHRSLIHSISYYAITSTIDYVLEDFCAVAGTHSDIKKHRRMFLRRVDTEPEGEDPECRMVEIDEGEMMSCNTIGFLQQCHRYPGELRNSITRPQKYCHSSLTFWYFHNISFLTHRLFKSYRYGQNAKPSQGFVRIKSAASTKTFGFGTPWREGDAQSA